MSVFMDANSALLDYFDTLLVDKDSPKDATAPPAAGPLNEEGIAAGSEPLRVLFFKVAGVSLAVAMENVAGVVDVKQVSLVDKALQDGTTLGYFSYRGRDICALDTRKILFANGHRAGSGVGKEAHQHIVMLVGRDCGLLCDEVGGVVNLRRSDVEWREQRRSRPWLAGMVRGYNHAYLDIDEFMRAYDLKPDSGH